MNYQKLSSSLISIIIPMKDESANPRTIVFYSKTNPGSVTIYEVIVVNDEVMIIILAKLIN